MLNYQSKRKGESEQSNTDPTRYHLERLYHSISELNLVNRKSRISLEKQCKNCDYSLGPHIADPKRTRVAPSSIATSKSFVIPMDNPTCPTWIDVFLPMESLKLLSCWKYDLLFSGSTLWGGTVIKPVSSIFGLAIMNSTTSSNSRRFIPVFVSSPERLISR